MASNSRETTDKQWLLPLRQGVEVIFAHFHLLDLTLTIHFEDDQLSI